VSAVRTHRNTHGTTDGAEALAALDRQPGFAVPTLRAFEEPHHPVAYWARLWGFSAKTIREWFRDEFGPGILRQQNSGRRSKREYTTMMIAPSAAARVYTKRSRTELIH
jgi:hypothetical protein